MMKEQRMVGLMASQMADHSVVRMADRMADSTAALRAYRWVVRKAVPRAATMADHSGDSKAAR